MVTILLQTIIELLTGWKDSFFTWANEIGDKTAAIKTNSDSLPDIKSNTDDIKDNTAAVITPISNINTNVSAIAPDVASIKADTAVIKNNANAIMTSSGQTAAYAEDIADNTLDCSNRLVTIGSDTTQIRAESGSMAADVAEIKNTLGLYLYNTIVTEDAEGSIANFDTDLKDYLQNAVVTIPADANGISGIAVINCGANLWDEETINNPFGSKNFIKVVPSSRLFFVMPASLYAANGLTIFEYDTDKNLIYTTLMNQANYGASQSLTVLSNCCYIKFNIGTAYGTTYNHDIGVMYPSTENAYRPYNAVTNSITFTSPITDGAEVDLLTGKIKINTSPVTYDYFTPIAIRTLKGVNNVYSDIGDMSVTYRESLKHYLEKQEGN